MNKMKDTDRLLEWLNESTSNFMAVKTICHELDRAGFKKLKAEDKWEIIENGKYYVVKNESAVLAFIAGASGFDSPHGFHIVSAHSDSPGFKIKPSPEIYGEGGLVSLNVEKYGGGILYTWFDRPLSVSGRVAIKSEDPMYPEVRIIDLKKPFATIPHLAIHFNRQVNDGNPLSVQKDMLPVIGYFSIKEIEEKKKDGGFIKSIVAQHIGVKPEEILDYELSLYPFEKAILTGLNQEFIQSGRIDDLSMAFAGLEALLKTADVASEHTRVLAIFDNEETGSGTKQGAASPALKNILERVSYSMGGDKEMFLRNIATSFMISADNAHAWHPNYKEKFDPTNHALIGHGPVIKINSNCKYMTDSKGGAVFKSLCEKAGVEYQMFVNHSDIAGGSTLGNIFTSQMDIDGVDVGSPIWAMHSACETGAVNDHFSMIRVFEEFWKI